MSNKTFCSPLWNWGNFRVSGTGDKRPNIRTKDAPIALSASEIPRVLGAVCQKQG